MTVDTNIARLTPYKEPQGDRVLIPPSGVPVSRNAEVPSFVIEGELQKENAILKTSGAAMVDTGNHWQGMPQLHPELRAYAETAINLGNVSGNIVINPARANVFYMNLTGGANISISNAWPQGYVSDGGIDISASLLIQKGAGSLVINTNYWGPEGETPDLSPAGFYEISLAVCVFSGFQIIRAWPSIIPAVV